MKRRIVSMMLTVAMGATLLAGCGNSAGGNNAADAAGTAGTESAQANTAVSGEEGSVINIYSWNDEFRGGSLSGGRIDIQ